MEKIKIHHLNCVEIQSPMDLRAIGHCLLLETKNRLIMIDTGIGLVDIQNPIERIGKEAIEMVGYRFDESQTAIRQIEKLGLDPSRVTDCIISHLDNDHIGGLPDFPNATVHVGLEEYINFNSGNPRYLQTPLLHNPKIVTYGPSESNWYGLESRPINVGSIGLSFIPLFGHSHGHCGIAIDLDSSTLFYVADAYYLREELKDDTHPVCKLAENRADNNELRIATLNNIRQFVAQNPEIKVFGYHDINEFNQFSINL